MPNNANARREKDKKKKDKETKSSFFPLHKEDKASADSGTLSLSLSAGSKERIGNSADAKNKNASPLLLHLGTVKKTPSPSLRAEPKSDAPLQWKNSLSLTDEERATVYY